MLPQLNGFEVCQRLKQAEATSYIPIIMLTAKGETSDKVEGIEIGADDYVTKPFDLAELKARIKAVLRRTAPWLKRSKSEALNPKQIEKIF